MYKIMTPGPTQVRANVGHARSLPRTNPDLDITFFDDYKRTCEKIASILGSSSPAFILGGEGILGLEAACASLTEEGDNVLVLDNGIFGNGFAEFVALYGGKPVLYSTDYRKPIDVEELERFLSENSNFKYATLVHMDTPSGVLNPIDKICPLLKKYGILTVVDSVAGMFGEEISVDKSQVDILCGGSQKALSAPPGLTILTISAEAFKAMENRKSPIKSFYANILLFKDYYEKKYFPYTMPISDIAGLDVALDNVIEDKDIFKRHEKLGSVFRNVVINSGLSLYLDSGFSNNVTAIEVPENIKDTDVINLMKEDFNILIAGSIANLSGKVIRIGHMGENSNIDDLADTLFALQGSLEKLGFKCKVNMKEEFLKLV